MIGSIQIGNIREGSWAGTIAILVSLDNVELTEENLNRLEQIIEKYQTIRAIQFYVPKALTEDPERIMGYIWAKFYQTHMIQVVSHVTRLPRWFQYAHSQVIKVLRSNYVGIPASEYHVMFTPEDLDKPDDLFFGQSFCYATVSDPGLTSKLFNWIQSFGRNPWKILSPQKLSLSKDLT